MEHPQTEAKLDPRTVSFASARSIGETVSLLLADGKVEATRQLVRRHAAEAPDEGEVWMALAASCLSACDDRDALAAYRRAWLLTPDDRDLAEIVAELVLTAPEPDPRAAARASSRLEPERSHLAQIWAQAARRAAECQQGNFARTAAWEAQRLAGPGDTSAAMRFCRQLADVDLDPLTSEPPAQILAERGYAVIRGADAAQVDELRRAVLASHGRSSQPLASVLPLFPALVDVLLQSAVTEWLRCALGTPYLMVRFANAASHFYTPWHTDSADMSGRGRDFAQGPSTLMLTMLLYLQDNRPFSGGGLSVMPGSHRSPDDFIYGVERVIATRAGDLLIIDTRLLHRATLGLPQPIDPEPKVLFQVNWAANAEYARRYMAYYMHKVRGQARALDAAFLTELERRCATMGIGMVY